METYPPDDLDYRNRSFIEHFGAGIVLSLNNLGQELFFRLTILVDGPCSGGHGGGGTFGLGQGLL